jgi:hypothetical protein
MTTHPEPVDLPLELLRRLNPVAEAPVTAGVDEALGEVARAITRQPHTTRRRSPSSRLKIALAAGGVALIGVGVATAAVVLHAHTGIFASGNDVQVGGPGENLNEAAPDFRSVALKLSADIPYPAAYSSWRDFVLTEQAPGPGGASSNDQVTTGALRGWFSASAFCAWVQDWRQALIAGNSAEAQQAAATITSAPGWSAVTAEDPHPSPSASNAPGAEPGTLFGWMLPYRAAVRAGDRADVEQLLASGYGDGTCWLSDPAWMTLWRAQGQEWRTQSQIAEHYRQFLVQERP